MRNGMRFSTLPVISYVSCSVVAVARISVWYLSVPLHTVSIVAALINAC